MLSILIPVYNFDIRKLVADLHNQATNARVAFEIVVIDDLSSEEYRTRNKEIAQFQNVHYIELEKNIGRAAIRNKLVDESHFPYMLFMDCDAEVANERFIQNYLDCCTGDVVVCGGTEYHPQQPEREFTLRWYYGIKREMKPASLRSQNPNMSFSTFNFLISRSVFEKVKFDSSINGYGHEDTLFGYELQENGFVIRHIDNQLIHLGLDKNEIFIHKTKEGVKNLYLIAKDPAYKHIHFEDFKIYHYYQKLKKMRMVFLMIIFYKLFSPAIELQLRTKKPRMFLFDLLKLGHLCVMR